MAEKTVDNFSLDRAQVKKSVQALLAFLKSQNASESQLLDESDTISLLFTLWKIPKKAQTIRIPLPHGQRTEADEVCLFTRDEPKMTSDQTQRFYKKLLEERGVKNVTEVIPYKVLKTEYKPFEAKRRLLANFDLFLSDDRIRRLLPSHIGKHFYARKKEPLSVNLQLKQLADHIQRVVQGSSMKVSNRGACCMARVAHSGMSASDIAENIEAAVQTVAAKLRTHGPVLKLVHLKSSSSVALPIYTSRLEHLTALEDAQRQTKARLQKKAAARKLQKKNKAPVKTADQTAAPGKEDEKDEEIPQLVPIDTPSERPKAEKPSKRKKLEMPPKPVSAKKGKKAKDKPAKNKRSPSRKRKTKATKSN